MSVLKILLDDDAIDLNGKAKRKDVEKIRIVKIKEVRGQEKKIE